LDRTGQGRLKLKTDFLDPLSNAARSFMGSERYVHRLNDFSDMLRLTRDLAKKRSGEVSVLPELERWEKKKRAISSDTSCKVQSLKAFTALSLKQFADSPLVLREEDVKSFASKPLQV